MGGKVMCGAARCALVLLSFALASGFGRAMAQDNFDAGKKPAELFANDCSACHKSPAGLSKAPGLFGLESFLREHYTASRQAAAAIAGYLQAVDAAQPPPRAPAKRRKSEPRSKSADKPARQEEKKEEKKPAEAKPAEPKSEAKAASEKPPEPKASDSKPAEDKKKDKSD